MPFYRTLHHLPPCLPPWLAHPFGRVPPLQLSTLTQVAALYLDYSFWEFEEPQDGPALR